MSIMKLGRFAALESDVPDSPVLGADDLDESGAPVDASNTVEAAAIDAAEVEQPVIEETNEELETLDDSAESLEAYLDFIKEAKQNGGMDKNTAKAVKIGLDNALRPLGTNSADFLGMSKASLESFDTNRRLNQTVSLENSITEALKSVWEAIKRGLNKLISYVRDWWLKNFDVAIRIKKRAEKIKSKANETNGSAKENKIDVPNIKQLHISKKAPTSAQIISSIEKCTNGFTKISSKRVTDGYGEFLDKVVDAVESGAEEFGTKGKAEGEANGKKGKKGAKSPKTQKVVDAVDNTADETKEAAAASGATNAGIPDHATRFSNLGDLSNEVTRSEEICGGKAVFGFYDQGYTDFENGSSSADKGEPFENVEALEEAGKFISKIFLSVMDYTAKKVEVDSSVSGSTLKLSEVESICTVIISSMEEISRYKQNYAKYETYVKRSIQKLDAQVTKSSKTEDQNVAKATRILAKGASSMIKFGTRTINSFMSYLIVTSRAALGYCTSSLAQYKD